MVRSEQKQLETHLHQAQKMEAIGTLAGGIAHDFNNQLMPVLGYSDMILENPDSLDDREEALSMITEIIAPAYFPPFGTSENTSSMALPSSTVTSL